MAALNNKIEVYGPVLEPYIAFYYYHGTIQYAPATSGVEFELKFALPYYTDHDRYIFACSGFFQFGVDKNSRYFYTIGAGEKITTEKQADLYPHVLKYSEDILSLDGQKIAEISQQPNNSDMCAPYNCDYIYVLYFLLNNSGTIKKFVPAKVSGNWAMKAQDGSTATITSDAIYGSLTGERFKMADLDNDTIDDIKETDVISILGDELSYDTMELQAKEKNTFTMILVDGNLEYAEANGLQYLLLPDYTPTRFFRIEFEFAISETVLSAAFYMINLFYFHQFSGAYVYREDSGTPELIFYWNPESGTQNTRQFSFENIQGKHKIVLDFEDGNLLLDGQLLESGISISAPDTGEYAVIGKAQNNLHEIEGKIYSCKVWNGTTKYFDLQPCVRNNTVGFLNSVNSSFLKSSSNREFYTTIEPLPHEVVVNHTDFLTNFPFGSQFLHYIDNTLKGKFYLEKPTRTGKRKYSYNCFSAIGMLDRQYFIGGIYQAATFSSVVAAILGSSVPYTVRSPLASERIFGWLPYGTKRNALRQLLFAVNAHIFKDSSGDLVFDYLDESNVAEIPTERIFEKGSVEYPKLATKVSITEHAFYALASTSSVSLFDNTAGDAVTGQLIVFKEAPIRINTLSASGGLSFTDATVNTAIVTGQGTLTGTPYAHVTRVIERTADDPDREEYEVSVTDATLVTAANSENVADRVADYYFNRFIVHSDIKWDGEKCGTLYSLLDAFGEQRTGFLQKIEKAFSSFVRGACQFLCGISAGEPGSNYQNYVVISSSQSWTPPAGTERIRLTLIGGGDGGSSGVKGKPGDGSSGGAGGGAGRPGAGGKVFVVTLEITDSSAISIVVGAGGTGGAASSSEDQSNSGTAGGDTTATYKGTTYSSATGSSKPAGVANIFNEAIYALPGENGISGGDGGDAGQGGESTPPQTKNTTGENGGDVSFNGTTYSGGTGGTGASASAELVRVTFNAGGGGGGGACATSAGTDGSVGTVDKSPVHYDDDLVDETANSKGGSGGHGASPSKRTTPLSYGSGGHAGHGGGGGGGCGTGTEYSRQWGNFPLYVCLCSDNTGRYSYAGLGGYGGAGGNGAAGCVLIYY